MKLVMITIGLLSSILSLVCLEAVMWTERWGYFVFVVAFFALAYAIRTELRKGTFNARRTSY